MRKDRLVAVSALALVCVPGRPAARSSTRTRSRGERHHGRRAGGTVPGGTVPAPASPRTAASGLDRCRRRRRRRPPRTRCAGGGAAEAHRRQRGRRRRQAGSCDGFKNGPGITDTDDHHRQLLGHLRPGARPLRVHPGRGQGLRRLLQLHQRHLRPQAEAGHLRQPHRRRRRPAGLRQGLRRGLRDGRLDVGLRLRWRGDGAVLRAARHPLRGGHQRPQRLLDLLPGPVGQHRRVGERARRVHQEELPGRRRARRGPLHQRRRRAPRTARSRPRR